MRRLISILILCALFFCTNKHPEKISAKNSFAITAVDVPFPLELSSIDAETQSAIVSLNVNVVEKIEAVAKEFAATVDFYDSSQTYRDAYVNTIQLKDSLQTLYLVLLKHYPTGALNSKILFYNNLKNEFIDATFDFNLQALYNLEKGKFVPTNLKTELKITSPEIECLDYDKDGTNDFKFSRLYHNGTASAIQTIIVTLKNSTVDTLYFNEQSLLSNRIP